MWKRNGFGIAVAALLAGTSVQTAAAQDYYGNGYDQYGGSYDDGYGYDQYDAQYGANQYGDQYGASVDFDYFYDNLAPHGRWSYHPRWGRVWSPTRVGADFSPYSTGGYWRETVEYGHVWVSDYDWGRIPFHYGRWVRDPYAGWLWVPGYVWAPSWVIWRSGGGYLGWFPMPPTNDFLLGVEVYSNDWRNWDSGFGYTDWYGPQYGASFSISLWIFVEEPYFGCRDWHRYAAPRNRVTNIVRNTVNITNYTTVNNYIVNRSVDRSRFDRGGRNWDRPVRAREVLHDGPRTRVDNGRRIAERERGRIRGDVNASPRERVRDLRENERGDRGADNNRARNPRAENPRGDNPRRRQDKVVNERPGGRNPDIADNPRRPRENARAQQQRERQEAQRGQQRQRDNARAEQRQRQEVERGQQRQRDNARAQQQQQRERTQAEQRQRQEAERGQQRQRDNARAQQQQRERAQAQQRQRQEAQRSQQRQQAQEVRAQRQQQQAARQAQRQEAQNPRAQRRQQAEENENRERRGRRFER